MGFGFWSVLNAEGIYVGDILAVMPVSYCLARMFLSVVLDARPRLRICTLVMELIKQNGVDKAEWS